jgi:hypothetical protein
LKKTITILSIIFAIGVIAIIAFIGYKFYKDFNSIKSSTKLRTESYYKNHHKEINEGFVVDTIQYKVTNFIYYPKADTTILFVDIDIENKTNTSKNFKDSFFILKEGAYKTYYPKIEPYLVSKNYIHHLKLLYILPEKLLPYLRYELHINSKTDTAQNGMIVLYKDYRANG